ncbi:MAG: hypothetical protein K2R98_05655 [Gemmataceae bacterium]|nr:hypothetical protein [Gemmataceae bacterium]
MRLRGHFDGQQIVLDQPVPSGLKVNTPVEVVILDTREQALQEMQAFLKEFWARPLLATGPKAGRHWGREDLYERGGQGVS